MCGPPNLLCHRVRIFYGLDRLSHLQIPHQRRCQMRFVTVNKDAEAIKQCLVRDYEMQMLRREESLHQILQLNVARIRRGRLQIEEGRFTVFRLIAVVVMVKD